VHDETDSERLLVLERGAGGAGGGRHLEHSSPRGRIRGCSTGRRRIR
jgi:hypothetical protein